MEAVCNLYPIPSNNKSPLRLCFNRMAGHLSTSPAQELDGIRYYIYSS
jgi:hypothetical protein